MTPARAQALMARYPALRIGVLGDVCLDRYLEIDPALEERSIETGLPVHNVVRVRAQPGGTGTIINNLAALGVGSITVIGACGDDGEGFELRRALARLPGVNADEFATVPGWRTFTYCKPILCRPGLPPEELSRLDSKNWEPAPTALEEHCIQALHRHGGALDALIVLDQVDCAGTGVITARVLAAVAELAREQPAKFILADSRRTLRGFPPVSFKMNAAELEAFTGTPLTLEAIHQAAARLATAHQRPVFITLAERGLLGAQPDGETSHLPALPVREPIDVVGAGDAVTTGLTAAFAAGAELVEALSLANAAASVVIHQLGTTGTASPAEILERLAG
jgi:rfaE bifunctional protein kinase chain/domain